MSKPVKVQGKELEVQELNDEALEDVAGGNKDINQCTVINICNAE